MADEEHLAILRQGVQAWNAWRQANPGLRPDLSGANLDRADLSQAKLHWTNLYGASLQGTVLNDADLIRAELTAANASGAKCARADFRGALFTSPHSETALTFGANLRSADLTGANLTKVDLTGVNLAKATLRDAHLTGSIMEQTDLRDADLCGANLSGAVFVGTLLQGANLRDCLVCGCTVWNSQLDGANQVNLRITPNSQPLITVDNLKVAQFLYLMLHNDEIPNVIETLTCKVVLILGRFTPERKAVLNALHDALLQSNYVPVLFDFEGPSERNVTDILTSLAHMARFIIADLTEPASIPQELEAIVRHVHVPVQPLIAQGAKPDAMFSYYRLFSWVLAVHRYASLDDLLTSIEEKVIAPAEAKVVELQNLRQADTTSTET
jgi:uncharacterized protein YjbI with pentapeptide repeats